MSPNWKFSPAYYERSLNTLNTALGGCSGYKSWREFDPGPGFPIDARYAAMPWLTKKDIREHFPDGFVPPGRNLKQAMENDEIWFVTTSGTMDLAVTNIWNPAWWFASERVSWKLNSHLDKICTPEHTEAILANPINVLSLPELGMWHSGNIALFMWPAGYPGFVLETSGNLSPAAWVVVPYAPFQFGDEYFLPLNMTGTNGFYRLQFPGP